MSKNDVSRVDEAKRIYAKTASLEQTAKRMGIKESTVWCYISQKEPRRNINWKLRKRGRKIKDLVREQLKFFGLPLKWEAEAVKAVVIYQGAKKESRGRHLIVDTNSILQLLCRQHRFPTPQGLINETTQGSGARRLNSGYMDVVKTMNGITAASPIEYVEFFCRPQNISQELVKRCDDVLSRVPKKWILGKNPRTIAAALIYLCQRGDVRLTQKVIADKLSITEVALRSRAQELKRFLREDNPFNV